MLAQSKIPELLTADITACDAVAVASAMPWHSVKTWLDDYLAKAPPWTAVASTMASVDMTLAMALAPVIFSR